MRSGGLQSSGVVPERPGKLSAMMGKEPGLWKQQGPPDPTPGCVNLGTTLHMAAPQCPYRQDAWRLSPRRDFIPGAHLETFVVGAAGDRAALAAE